MVKSLLLVAILANIIYLVNAGRAQSFAQSSAVSSASSSGATSQSYASANAGASQYGRNQQAVATSSAVASASSTSNGNQPRPCDSHPVPPCQQQAVATSSAVASASSTSNGNRPPPCDPRPVPSCRINEEWSNCPVAVCRPKTCDDVGFPVACPDLRPNGCCPVKPGCICREGYVRNYAGICIPMTHCPRCGGDPYAISGCGMNCNQLCSNYNKKPGVCALGCMYNSCNCREGYVFDEIKKICVLPCDCTFINCTKKHEVYDPCPPFCPMNTCGIDDAAISCVPSPLPGDPNCPPPVCRCENGYYRNDVGECVLWKHCPRCKGLNEKYDPCPAPCPPQRCDVNIALILCAVPPKLGDPECKPGCRCIDDHVRNQTGVCIPRDQCPTCPNKNEVYDACIAPCPPRRCDVDERLIKCAAPPQLGDPSCVAGCRCDDGFYKNSQGVCVTKDECVICDGPHEYLDCGRPCDNVCATLHEQNQTNCKVFNKKCTEMCYCEEGYARDKNNICIPIEKCDERRCKCKHEIFSECVQAECRPKYCSQLGFPVPCPRIDPKYCKKGCLCKDGFLRDDDGNCVPVDQCPQICGVNEVFNNCIQGDCRPQNCSQLGFPVPCRRIDPKYCKTGCLCKEDFLRDSRGICVPNKKCPSCGGDPNAGPGCGKNCGRLCSNYKQKNVVCTLECKINGCDCKKDYVFDTNEGRCVLPKNCSPVCKKDEVYSSCINGGCNPKNCSQIGRPVPCIKLNPKYCIKGCLCKDGLLRDDDGKCVPAKDCKNVCNRPNEYYEPCDYNCPPRTCDSLDKAYVCPIREEDTCKPQCKCKKGFYRDRKGNCITEKQCRMCNKPHESYACGGACDNVCSEMHKQNQTRCPIINIKCNERCYCDEDYARAKNGTCIPISKCYEPQCRKNERYEKCPAWLCEPQKCSQLGYPVDCPDHTSGCKCPVKPSCVCVNGYVKAANGTCIPKKNCPSCGGDPNAHSGCGTNCGNRCEDLGNKPCPCPEVCKINGCDCKDGYYFDKSKGKCVLPSECTGVCSGKHEVFEDCKNPRCSPKKCSEVGFPLNCTDPPKCNKGCVCKHGYVRSAHGHCIPMKYCPSCGGDKNAESGCGINCLKKCYDLENPDHPKPCPKICKENACDCKKNYYWDENLNTCVLAEDCSEICSGKHEVFEDCKNPRCSPKKCSEVGFPLNCTDPPKCNKGCVCKHGYVRSAHGHCIPMKYCPSCGGDKNAESGCGINCLKKCYDLENPDHPKPCPKICKENACDCKKNYYWDENLNTCVLAEDCSPICGKYEIFDPCINGGCSIKNCTQLSRPKVCVRPKKCRAGCACKDGYLRDAYGDCIPIEKCPQLQCGKNERFEKCPAALCKPLRCDQLGFQVKCPDIKEGTCPGHPGCVCKDDLVRDKNGKCIPKRNCPSCGGDPNACSGCGVNCGKKCEDIGSKNRICPRICFINACDCKENFYLDSNSKKCVPADSCTPKCRENEVLDSCVNGGCRHRNCSQFDGPIICIDPIKCKQGCTCKKGYLRVDATGVCVPEEKCPNICNKPNEEYVKCPPKCPPQTCESLNKTYHCPLMKTNQSDCTGECRCKKGFYRNLNGECICKSDCLKCPKKHEYFSCGPACDNVCCDLDVQTKDNCIIKNIKCVERCYCEDGYARIGDEDSECVPISDCPAPKCGKNEEVDSCVNGGCRHRNCSQFDGPILCIDPIKCKEGCTCKKGYLRVDATGVCVPEEKCPNICNKPNEEYVKCPPKCPPQTCESLNKTYHCPLMKTNQSDCTGECRCKKGFYRNLNGECICKSDCLKCPKKHEYFSCGPACDNVCCDLDVQTKDNCIIKNIKCVERCYCEDGYARIGDEDSECVPISDCPGRGNPTPKPTVNTTEAITYFEEGNTILSISFLRQLLDSRPGENIMFSTYSLMNVMGQLLLPAEGNSLDQLLDIMYLDNKEQVRAIFLILIQRLQGQKDVKFQSTNKIYGTHKAPFSELFKRDAKIFNSEVENIDFAKNIEAAETINEWVEDETNGLIKDIANPDMFSSLTRMAIFNCLYFQGNWVHQFNPKSTQLRDFYINAKDKISIQTMYLKATLKYALIEDLNAQALLLPYKGNKFNMLFILPGEDSDLNTLVEQLNPDNISMIEESLKPTPVIAYIPRIDIKCDIPDMKDILIKNNLTAIFKASSDFSAIFENKNEKLYVSDVVQKSAIKLDETGTEAASSTGAIITARSQALPSMQTIFNANRPFLLILKYLDSILFCGAFVR